METTTQTAELQAGKWYRMAVGPCSDILVAAIKPTGRKVQVWQAGNTLTQPAETWEGISDDGDSYSDFTARDLYRLGIGGLRGPVADLPDLDAEMIEALKGKKAQADWKRKADATVKATQDAAIRAELPGLFPHLVPLAQTPGRSSWAAGAANLRRELEKAFPGIKFKTTSKSYSGGCSINASWDYGPPESAVSPYCDKYSTKDFDPMQDLETIRRSLHADVFGGAGYVFANRGIPYDGKLPGEGWFDASLYGLIARELCRLQGIAYKASPWQRGLCGDSDIQDMLHNCNKLLSRTTFPAGFTLAQFGGVERVEWVEGQGYVDGEPWRIVLK